MPKKFQPAGDYWFLKVSTLKVNAQLCVNTEEEMVEKKIENEEEDTRR